MYIGAINPVRVVEWLVFVGVSGCVIMGVDKAMARGGGSERISERTLWLTALGGGFWGIILGAMIFHHKTRKASFWPPVVFASLIWILLPVLVLEGIVTL